MKRANATECVRSLSVLLCALGGKTVPFRQKVRLRALPRTEPIRDQRDKLAVGRLIVQRADVLAEGLVQRVDAPAVPRHLDGMANRAFHLAGRRAEAVGNAGIKLLGDAPHQLRVIHHHAHRLAQILIALDVGGDADLVDDGSHLSLIHI